jgi:hypothetical protein
VSDSIHYRAVNTTLTILRLEALPETLLARIASRKKDNEKDCHTSNWAYAGSASIALEPGTLGESRELHPAYRSVIVRCVVREQVVCP